MQNMDESSFYNNTRQEAKSCTVAKEESSKNVGIYMAGCH